jgi:hypothetical protein
MSNGRLFWGVFLVVVGGIFFLDRIGLYPPIHFSWRLWPLILVFFGIATLVRIRVVKIIAVALAAVCSGLLVTNLMVSHTFFDGECVELDTSGCSSNHVEQVYGTTDISPEDSRKLPI